MAAPNEAEGGEIQGGTDKIIEGITCQGKSDSLQSIPANELSVFEAGNDKPLP